MKKQNVYFHLVVFAITILTVASVTVYGNDDNPVDSSPIMDSILDLKTNPHNKNELYAVVERQGLFRSIDKGDTWIYCGAGLPNDDLMGIDFDPVERVIYARTSSALFRSYDFIKWVKLAEFRWPNILLIQSTDQSKILYMRTGDGLLFSKDEHAWEKTDRPESYSKVDFYIVAIDRTDPGIVYFAVIRPLTFVLAEEVEAYKSSGLWKDDDSGIYRSSDQGKTVERILSTRSDVLSISPSVADVMYSVGTDNIDVSRILKSNDRGASWEVQGKLEFIKIEKLFLSPVDHNILYAKTIDNRHLQNINYDPLDNRPLDDRPQAKPLLLRSSNGGKTWQDISSSSPFNKAFNSRVITILPDPLNPKVLYVGAANGLFKSTDVGKTWKAIQISK